MGQRPNFGERGSVVADVPPQLRTHTGEANKPHARMLPAVRLPAVALLAAASTLPTTSAIGPRIASQEEILEMADEWCAITSITLVTRFVGTLCWLDLAGSTTLMRTRMANLISLNYRRCSRSSRKALR